MQNGYIEVHRNKAMSLAAGLGTSQAAAVCRAVVSFVERADDQLASTPPHFTLVK